MLSNEIIGSAFVIGLAGSLHCVGMCGPLALSLPVSHKNDQSRLVGGIIYNSGRIFSYALLGLVSGSIGRLIISSNWQSKLSIILGIIILLFLLVPKKLYASTGLGIFNTPFTKLRQALGHLFHSTKLTSIFSIGILNGFLPCGLVYLALTSSLLTGGMMNGALFMSFFGLGTFPMMLATVFMGSYLNQQIRMKIKKAIPVFLFLMATLLILRGLNFNIPFLNHDDANAVICTPVASH